MSRIVFHSIRAKNFLQIGNDFATFNLQKSPFTVIVGKNGSGKSTLLDMLAYVLYNKAYRPKFTLGQLVNCVNKKKMVVEIAFTTGVTTYIVRRGEKPKVFEIYRNNELIKPDPSIGDMQTYLEEKILGQNYKTFCQINVIGKASYKQFLTLSPAERRSVVEDILDSSVYSIMSSLAKEDYKDLSKIVSEQDRDIQILESKINTTKTILKQYEEDKSSQINELKQNIDTYKKSENDLQSKLSELEERLKNDEALLESIIPTQHRVKFDNEITRITGELGGFDTTRSRAQAIINKIDSMEKCPHCMQIVDENHKREIVEASEKEIASLVVQIETHNQKLTKFREIRNKFMIAQDAKRETESEISLTKSKLSSIRGTLEHYSDQVRKLTTVTSNPNLPNIDELNNEMDSLVVRKDLNVSKQSKLKSAISLLGDDGIKAKLIGKYIPIINKSVNDYLERMNMFVSFELDSEFCESVKAINRESFTYSSFSEGQKMRIDLAILLTWRKIAQLRNSMSTNIFILDEIADGSLDQEGMDEFLMILKEVADAQNTILISHKDSTIDMFDNVIRAETVGNFTRYVNE